MSKENNKCIWKLDDNDNYIFNTSCNKTFFFDTGDIKDNEFKYCPYCGEEIIENE